MAFTIEKAKTDKQKEEIFRLRYRVYTLEMHLYESTAVMKINALKIPKIKQPLSE